MTNQKTAVARLEAVATRAGQEYLEKEGFVQLFPPRLVRASGACENIDTLFSVSGNGQNRWWQDAAGNLLPAYLAQTGQLYLEAFVPSLKKVYCIGPSFRAEPKIDNRHLTEFTMTEIEFAGDFEDLLRYIENYLKAIARQLIDHESLALNDWGLTPADLTRLRSLPLALPRTTYDEAITILKNYDPQIAWGDDISTEHEKMLIKHFGNQPLFITRYPDPSWNHGQEIEVEKFFNMIPDPQNPGRVLSTDLILPFAGEAVGAAARIYDLETLKQRLTNSRMFKRLQEKGGTLDDFAWYIANLENTGSLPHAGCGFGMSRILQWLRASNNITECVTFPANRGNLI
ncbi:MAG: amino acid--tRNA ligase-related protein [Patescibacteria group bacterium]|jgi:aspartyl/asparaginyl-tRNA synthetase